MISISGRINDELMQKVEEIINNEETIETKSQFVATAVESYVNNYFSKDEEKPEENKGFFKRLFK